MSLNLGNFGRAIYAFDAVGQRTDASAWQNDMPCDGLNAAPILDRYLALVGRQV